MPREVDEVACGSQDVLGALRHLQASVGERNVARAPLDQIGTDLALEFAYLHGQSGLGHGAILGGAPEMPVPRKCSQITKLSQGDHSDKLFLSLIQINTIRPDRGSFL